MNCLFTIFLSFYNLLLIIAFQCGLHHISQQLSANFIKIMAFEIIKLRAYRLIILLFISFQHWTEIKTYSCSWGDIYHCLRMVRHCLQSNSYNKNGKHSANNHLKDSKSFSNQVSHNIFCLFTFYLLFICLYSL